MNIHLIIAERNSPSDEEITCIDLVANSGDYVSSSKVVAEMEGAKAIFEIIAGADGFFYPFISTGQKSRVGTLIAVVVPEKLNRTQLEKIYLENNGGHTLIPNEMGSEINLSSAATILLEELDKDDKERFISAMKHRGFIREKDVADYIASQKIVQTQLSDISIEGWKAALREMEGLQDIVFIGGGYGALQVLDLITKIKSYRLVGFFSDYQKNILDEIGIPNLGLCNKESYKSYLYNYPGVVFSITVGMSPNFRLTQTEILVGLGVDLPNLIHPCTVIGQNARFGEGNIIFANVHIGADVSMGNSNFISSNSTIEHHNVLGDGNCFGPQVSTSGNVKIGDGCRFGSGVVVEPKIDIGSGVIVASHATITSNIQDKSVVKLIDSVRIKKEI